MALTGELNYKGLTIGSAYVKVMQVTHRAVDTNTEDEDGTTTWTKANHADYSVRVYKNQHDYEANPDKAVYTITGTFTPSVANTVNKNIVKQTYLHLKTFAEYELLNDC